MNTQRSILCAVGLLAGSVAMPSACLAQAEVNEPEPIVENCPCACEWGIMGNGPICDIFDFLEFQNAFVRGDPCAINKDTSTGQGVGDIFDFLVFQHEFINSMYGIC